MNPPGFVLFDFSDLTGFENLSGLQEQIIWFKMPRFQITALGSRNGQFFVKIYPRPKICFPNILDFLTLSEF